MPLVDWLNKKWRGMRAKRASGEESRRQVLNSLNVHDRTKIIIRFCLILGGSVFLLYIATDVQGFWCQEWTGFCENTTKSQHTKKLWDWLELSSRLAVPFLIFYLGRKFQKQDERIANEQEKREREIANEQEKREREIANEQAQREREIANEQAQREREIAQNNVREEAIKDYLDSMAKILLDEIKSKQLFSHNNSSNNNEPQSNASQSENHVFDVAQALTITILQRLEDDEKCQARIIRFLYNARLLSFIFEKADLSNINLSQAILLARPQAGNAGSSVSVSFKDAILFKANLKEANLKGANFKGALLKEAILEGANLDGAILVGVKDLNQIFKQIKSACNWDKAIYKGEWNKEEKTWVAIDPDNTNFIKKIENDTDPKEPPDCSRWNN